ncbi:GNAT family N-acetyltransferase [Actinoplanes sp. NPDC051494]|uniref:GNAT family N-acetyltransferase n=1 Tax=Actinoplanes sp. NPDC051494 TaxID=3363907 RepID=UPI0037B348E2
MTWRITEDVEEFLAAAGSFLRERAVENTVLITVAETVRREGPDAYGAGTPVFGWAPGAAFVRTPPFPIMMSDMPTATAEELARAVEGPLSGAGGPDPVVHAFTDGWIRRTGDTATIWGRLRLYRLGTLVPPTCAGTSRVAGPDDRDLLVTWTTEFFHEVSEGGNPADFVDQRLPYGGITLWENGGDPVAMAALTRPESGMVRIQSVYTPARHRRHGYAAGVTAAVSRSALTAGATDVVLFADHANPTANALYQRLGFVALQDRTTMEFTS